MASGSGIIGTPTGFKDAGRRVDFATNLGGTNSNFDALIEDSTVRLGWARAVRCSCVAFNEQTEQVDPQCAQCNALGFRYFKPEDYVADDDIIGDITDEQQVYLDRANAVVIRGYLQSTASQPDMFAVLGNWALGSALLSIRPENLLGYYDRIIDFEGRRPHHEVVVAGSGGAVKLRYPALCINSLTQRFTL